MSAHPRPNVGHMTHPGRVRPRNEDNFGVPPPDLSPELQASKGRLYLVADGVGGHLGGQRASQVAVQRIAQEYYGDRSPDPRHSLARAIRMANAEIYQEGQHTPELHKMGTTVTAAVVRGHELLVANVGDSRAYLARGSTLRQLTQDHSFVAEGLRNGTVAPEQVSAHLYQGAITRALGKAPDVQPDFFYERLQPGDSLLLCSDGLTNEVDDQQIASIIRHSRTAQEAAKRLVDQANRNGGRDNVTAVVLEVNGGRRTGTAMPPAWILAMAGGAAALALIIGMLAVLGGGQATPTPAMIAAQASQIMTPSVQPTPVQKESPGPLSDSEQDKAEVAPPGGGEEGTQTEDSEGQPTATKGTTHDKETEPSPTPIVTETPTVAATATPTKRPTDTPEPPPDYPPPELLEPPDNTTINVKYTFKWTWPDTLGSNLGFELQMSEQSSEGFETVQGHELVDESQGGAEYTFPEVDLSTIGWLDGKQGQFYWRIELIDTQTKQSLKSSDARTFFWEPQSAPPPNDSPQPPPASPVPEATPTLEK